MWHILSVDSFYAYDNINNCDSVLLYERSFIFDSIGSYDILY
jgi:hypothetical protein